MLPFLKRRFACVLVAALFFPAGMTMAQTTRPAPVDAEEARPAPRAWLLHLPGVGGERAIDHWLTDGLIEGGVDARVTIYDWTHGRFGMPALVDYRNNQEESRKIADMIVARRRADPASPIHLTAHSGGAGLLVWALEKLPPDVVVESVLLLAPALSPEYDLSGALSHVRGKMHVFSSEHDPVLGAGTRLFGTIDRVKTDAAGRVGFRRPAAADAEQYGKLVEHPYDSRWARAGNLGDHIGAMMEPFVVSILAPTLLTGEVPELERR